MRERRPDQHSKFKQNWILLGTSLGTSAESEVSHASLETLKKYLRPSLDVMADLVLNPSFPEEELERQRRQRLDGILQERNSPPNIARKVFRTVLFGENHPFGREVAGHEASVQAITRSSLQNFYNRYWKPNHSALIFAGDVDLDEAVRLAEGRSRTLASGYRGCDRDAVGSATRRACGFA